MLSSISSDKVEKILNKLKVKVNILDDKIKLSIKNGRRNEDIKALNDMKWNPGYFYSYAKRKSKLNNPIEPLYDAHGTICNDHKGMANILQEQYDKVFSNSSTPTKKLPPVKENEFSM